VRGWLGAALVAVACDATTTLGDGPSSACGSLYPGLRIESRCAGALRVTIDGRDLPPDPRTLMVDGATILAWPAWVRVGMPSVAHVGDAEETFTAEPYTCQVVTVSCP
jgi:hypothetical protein